MKNEPNIALSILAGFLLAGLVAVGLTILFPPGPDVMSVWNWDRLTRFSRIGN